jgi:PilZ domain-containing protein
VSWGKRASNRVSFERGYRAQIMGIDGTWRRDCTMLDVSASGVQLHVKESIAGLDLKEFFLLLSSTGLAYRRCELARIDGEHIGARFLQPSRKKATSSPSKPPHAESEY